MLRIALQDSVAILQGQFRHVCLFVHGRTVVEKRQGLTRQGGIVRLVGNQIQRLCETLCGFHELCECDRNDTKAVETVTWFVVDEDNDKREDEN